MKKNKKKNRKKNKHSFLKKFLIFLLLIIIIIAGYITFRSIKNGGGLSGFLSAIVGQSSEDIQNLEPVSALILGSSQNMTDTIIIAKYNPKTQSAYLISIPRDTFVGKNQNTAKASDKINSLYKGDSPEKTLNAVNKITNLNLKYYVVVDTEALKKLVDAIGGIYFDVPIDMNYTDKKQNLYINLKKGYQLLDGNKAEQVVRFRHNQDGSTYSAEYGDNDIGRMKTQRNFLKEVLKQTLKPSNVLKLGEIIDIAQKNIKTNIPSSLLKSYIPVAVNFNTDNLETETLPGSPEKCNGLWFFLTDKTKVESFISKLDENISDTSESDSEESSTDNSITLQKETNSSNENDLSKIKIEILNGSGIPSNLTKLSNKLKDKGYTVSKVGKTNTASKTTIINKSKLSEKTINKIKEIVGKSSVSSSDSENQSTNITIIIGKDFKE